MFFRPLRGLRRQKGIGKTVLSGYNDGRKNFPHGKKPSENRGKRSPPSCALSETTRQEKTKSLFLVHVADFGDDLHRRRDRHQPAELLGDRNQRRPVRLALHRPKRIHVGAVEQRRLRRCHGTRRDLRRFVERPLGHRNGEINRELHVDRLHVLSASRR